MRHLAYQIEKLIEWNSETSNLISMRMPFAISKTRLEESDLE